MNDLKLFDALGIDLRTGLNADGVAYVVATDLANALGVKTAKDITRSLGANEGGVQGTGGDRRRQRRTTQG